MESVWWVFKTLVEKNLVYRGYKVMPFSTACATPLSNFEAGLNYKDVQDPAVVVAFPLKNDPEVSLSGVVSSLVKILSRIPSKSFSTYVSCKRYAAASVSVISTLIIEQRFWLGGPAT